jgi:GTP1/Obg family GTP-binding protein
MKLTADPKRIDEAHYILQRLEDEIVGAMQPTYKVVKADIERIYKNRLDSIYKEVWRAIRCLNEAYDK